MTQEQEDFLKRVRDEVSGMVAMLALECRNDKTLALVIASELQRHAAMVLEVIYGDKRDAEIHMVRMILPALGLSEAE